MEKIFRIARQK